MPCDVNQNVLLWRPWRNDAFHQYPNNGTIGALSRIICLLIVVMSLLAFGICSWTQKKKLIVLILSIVLVQGMKPFTFSHVRICFYNIILRIIYIKMILKNEILDTNKIILSNLFLKI